MLLGVLLSPWVALASPPVTPSPSDCCREDRDREEASFSRGAAVHEDEELKADLFRELSVRSNEAEKTILGGPGLLDGATRQPLFISCVGLLASSVVGPCDETLWLQVGGVIARPGWCLNLGSENSL